MPRTCVFDVEKGAIFVEATGVFTDSEFRQGAVATVSDPRFRADMRTLTDFTKVTHFKVSAQSLDEFVRGRHFNAQARRAFVVAPGFGGTFVAFGVACGALEQTKTFLSREDAIAWLNEGVPADKHLI